MISHTAIGMGKAWLGAVALTVAALSPGAAAQAHAESQALYAVSVRVYTDPSYKGIEGSLYRVDPNTAASTLLAPLRLDGQVSIGLDGIAIHPKTGVFYGITAPSSASIPHSLVRVDPHNGNVSLVGDLGVSGSDLSFDGDGTLYVWIPATSQVGKIDLKSGAVTKLGRAGSPAAEKGGFEIADGKAMIAGTGARGTLDRVDLETGALVSSVKLSGARYKELINGLASSGRGAIFAVNTNGAAPALADLVRIDEKSGQVTTIGALPNDTDALTFGPALEPEKSWDLDMWRALSLAVLLAFLAGTAITAFFLRRR